MSVTGYQKFLEYHPNHPWTERQWSRGKVFQFKDMKLDEFDFSAIPDGAEAINLSGNNLKVIRVPERLQKLECILINDNQLIELIFEGTLPFFRALSAINNKLTTIGLISNMPKLASIKLDGNFLKELDSTKWSSSRMVLSVKDNPELIKPKMGHRSLVFS